MIDMKNEIINKLLELMELVPEQRFGQVLYNYVTHIYVNNDTFYVDDKDILDLLTNELENIKEQTQVRQMVELDEQIKALRSKKQDILKNLTEKEKEQYKKYFTNGVM